MVMIVCWKQLYFYLNNVPSRCIFLLLIWLRQSKYLSKIFNIQDIIGKLGVQFLICG